MLSKCIKCGATYDKTRGYGVLAGGHICLVCADKVFHERAKADEEISKAGLLKQDKLAKEANPYPKGRWP